MRRPYVESTFLHDADCGRVRAAMDDGLAERAAILQDGVALDEGVRRASLVEVDAATLAFVESRLDARRSVLASWFRRSLTAREGAGFVRYEAGGFYRPHRDRGDDPSWPAAARRQVAVVLFLNADFSGGLLRLLDWGSGPVDVAPCTGTLVAFPAETLHEVTPVHAGTRDAIVDWFY